MAHSTEQHWDPERYRKNAGFVAELGMPVVDLLAPEPGERILDLGCGDGALTEKLAAMGIDVVAVDSSPDQIAAAQERGLDAHVVDGHALTFDAEFDAVFSNAALHWMSIDPDRVIDGVWRALKPGGRFVGEMGGEGNVGRIRRALIDALDARGMDGASRDPWFFPSPEEYRRRLEGRGFRVSSIDLIPRPTPLPGDIRDWLDTFGEPFLKALPAEARAAAKDEIAAKLEPELRDADGTWVTDYVRLRFAASKAEGAS